MNFLPDEISAPEETASEIASPTRRQWLSLSAAACGAALLLKAQPAGAIGNGGAKSLRFLEEMELLQSDFFQRVAASSAYDSMEPRERDVFNLIAQQDREHATWFRLAREKMGVAEYAGTYLPNTSSSRPLRMFSFPNSAFSTRAKLFPFAIALKDTAVGAYHALVGKSGDAEVIQALAALAGVEGRHAATLREISGVTPLPSAFEAVVSQQQATRKLAAYGFKGQLQ